MSWTVSNNKLYSGATPVFIVATEFNFGTGNLTSTWTNETYQSNRARAGNAVIMWQCQYIAQSNNDPTVGAGRAILQFHNHQTNGRKLTYFCADMNLWDNQGTWAYRGSHTYHGAGVGDNSMTNGSGHWRNIPCSSSGDNSIDTDVDYYNNHLNLGDTTYWYPNTNQGTYAWHTNWLKYLKTATSPGSYYDKLFSWHLMDEPYCSSYHRDYKTNRYSVTGHYNFCTAVENSGTTDTRPKMVGIHPPVPNTGGECSNANDCYTNLSGAMDILSPNLNDPGLTNTNLWGVVNQVAWCWSKISNVTNKMVMPYLPYWLTESQCFYCFYGSLIEGACGITWWMTSGGTQNYQDYTYQKTIYSAFTSSREFKAGSSYPRDEEVILSGTGVSVTLTSEDNNYSESGFPKTITKKHSIKVFKHSNRYRIFAANHFTDAATFTARINTSEFFDSNWTVAWDNSHNSHFVTAASTYGQFNDSIPALSYRIYDIGAGN